MWVAEPAEAASVAALLGEFRDWWGRSWPPLEVLSAGVERLMREGGAEYLLAARAGEPAPAGVCQLRFRWGVWHGAEDCWLEDLYVRDGARGAGLGSALVEAALERARARGCARVELDVNEANPEAVALYERFGFSALADPPGGRNLLMRLPRAD